MIRQAFGVACVVAGLSTCSLDNLFGPAPPPGGKDGVGTKLGQACGVLRARGCPEGTPDGGRTCYEALVIASRTLPIPADCIIDASTTDDVRACGDPTRESKVRCRQ